MGNNEEKTFMINSFAGINLSSSPSTIADNESPDMLNMYVDIQGNLMKRKGYKKVNANTGIIRASFKYQDYQGHEVLLLAIGISIFEYTLKGLNATRRTILVPNGIVDGNILFFALDKNIYMMNGNTFYVLVGNGDQAEKFDKATPYVPTITMSMSPNGSGITFEDFNLAGNNFKCSYSSDGTSKVYQLTKFCDYDLEANLTVTINGAAHTGAILDTKKWTVTFTEAPVAGTNNVVIQAQYAKSFLISNLKELGDCTLYTNYGGANDTRVFLAGNKSRKNRIYRSAVLDATYFPSNGFYDIGTPDQNITGFSKQYDTLVIFKTHSIYLMSFEINEGQPLFSTIPLNDKIGCIAPNSIELLENIPVWLSDSGIYMLTGTNVKNERNVSLVSTKIDSRLKNELKKEAAICIDYDSKYFIKINNNIYVFDYKLAIWYVWNNINASLFFILNNQLYFTNEAGDIFYMYISEGEVTSSNKEYYIDDNKSINAYWYSKEWDFDNPYYLKNVKKIFYTTIPWYTAGFDIYETYEGGEEELIHSIQTDQPGNFTALSVRAKIKAKKIQRYQIKLQSNRNNEMLCITDIGLQYLPIKYVNKR